MMIFLMNDRRDRIHESDGLVVVLQAKAAYQLAVLKGPVWQSRQCSADISLRCRLGQVAAGALQKIGPCHHPLSRQQTRHPQTGRGMRIIKSRV